MSVDNLYEILQVQPTADSEIIQAAYRRLMLRYHPDRNDSADAQEMTQRLNRAYEILSDPIRRAAYDRESSGTYRGQGYQDGAERSPGPPPGSSVRSATRYIERLPMWAWLTLIGGAVVVASALILLGFGVSIDWISNDGGSVDDSVIEIVQDDRSGIVEEAKIAKPAIVTPLPQLPLAATTVAPTFSPTLPELTVREVFILESDGEITPEVAALLLRLLQRGFSPTLSQPGFVTRIEIAQPQDVCLYFDCVGGTISELQDDGVMLIVTVEPINPKEDENYTVWLSDQNGNTLNSQTIRWSADRVEPARSDGSAGESSLDQTRRAISVSMTIPIEHVSALAFIEEYNGVFLSGLREYEDEVILECELTVSPDGSILVGNRECSGKTFPPYQLDANRFAAVVGTYFTIDLLLESEFLERDLSKSD